MYITLQLDSNAVFYIVTIVKKLNIVVPILISVAYFTLAERKILGAIQRRMGPNVIGVYGLLQPLSDGLKLLLKETVLPSSANQLIFIISPILTFVISLMGWAIIPFDKYAVLSEINIGVFGLNEKISGENSQQKESKNNKVSAMCFSQ